MRDTDPPCLNNSPPHASHRSGLRLRYSTSISILLKYTGLRPFSLAEKRVLATTSLETRVHRRWWSAYCLGLNSRSNRPPHEVALVAAAAHTRLTLPAFSAPLEGPTERSPAPFPSSPEARNPNFTFKPPSTMSNTSFEGTYSQKVRKGYHSILSRLLQALATSILQTFTGTPKATSTATR